MSRLRVALALLLTAALSAACQSDTIAIAEQTGPQEWRRLGVGGNGDRADEYWMHDLAKDLPGVAGVWRENGERLVFAIQGSAVQSRRPEVEVALRRREWLSRGKKSIEIREASHSFVELASWRDRIADAVFGREGWSSLDLDEHGNVVRVGVSSQRYIAEFLSLVSKLDVPSSAVVLEVSAPAIQHQAPTLASRMRPMRGGIAIGPPNFENAPNCTLGAIVTWGGVPALLTASHCTEQQWGLDSHQSYLSQPQLPGFVFGPELKDRQGRACGALNLALCRRADAALYSVGGVDLLPGEVEASALGQIAQPLAFVAGSGGTAGTRTLATQPLRVVGTLEHPLLNQVVHRVGFKSGGAYGSVVKTCIDYVEARHKLGWATRILVCQSTAITASDFGDSGGPVFVHLGGDSVLFAGINHARDPEIPNSGIFSSTRQIRSELYHSPIGFHQSANQSTYSAQITGPSVARSGSSCVWWGASSIPNAEYHWFVNDSLVGTGTSFALSPLSSFVVSLQVFGTSGEFASTSFSVSVDQWQAPCADH